VPLNLRELIKARKLQGRAEVHGLPVSIENRRGSVRRWKGPGGKGGRTKMSSPYGYVRGTEGADGDALDCYVGPDKDSGLVFVVNQVSPHENYEFDEHKCLLGFSTLEAARNAYLAHADPAMLGSVTEMTVDAFKEWVASGKLKRPLPASVTELLRPPATETRFVVRKGGPFIGPKGGRWADAAHTIPWKEQKPKDPEVQALSKKDRHDLVRVVRALRGARRDGMIEISELSIETGLPDRRLIGLVKKHADLLTRKVGRRVSYEKPTYTASGERPVFKRGSTVASYSPAYVSLEKIKKSRQPWAGGFTREEVARAAKALGVDFGETKFGLDQLVEGMRVEREHADAVGRGAEAIAKVALAHLRELPDYYERLRRVEKVKKAGPFIGPRGGKWADPAHTIPWKEEAPKRPVTTKEIVKLLKRIGFPAVTHTRKKTRNVFEVTKTKTGAIRITYQDVEGKGDGASKLKRVEELVVAAQVPRVVLGTSKPEPPKPAATPPPPKVETPKPEPPKPAPPESPRGQAEVATKDAIAEGEYVNDRVSAVPQIGGDVLGSARHRAAEWKSLRQALDAGDAEQMFARKFLERQEPLDLISRTQQGSPANALVHLILHFDGRKFPSKPDIRWVDDESARTSYDGKRLLHGYYRGEGEQVSKEEHVKRQRQSYYEAYRKVREVLDKFSRKSRAVDVDLGDDPRVWHRELTREVLAAFGEFRKERGRYDAGTEALRKTYNAMIKGKLSPLAQASEFVKRLQDLYEGSDEQQEKLREHALRVMEGKSIPAAFGQKTAKGKPKIDVASMYDTDVMHRAGPKSNYVDVASASASFKEKYKMRLQWGKYVPDEERKHHLKSIVDSWDDLTDILGLPPEMASYGGKLVAIAVGARGKGNALAHYEPDKKVINLTRSGGAGSLAHEWGHFFDFVVGGVDDERLLTDRRYYRQVEEGVSGTRRAAQALMTSEGWETFRKRLIGALSKLRLGEKMFQYWVSPKEMFARSFERHVQRKLEKAGRQNTYLVSVRKSAADEDGLWPTDEEVDALAPLFDKLFEAFKKSDLIKKAVAYLAQRSRYVVPLSKAGGPFIGPRGGLWADPAHTIPWKGQLTGLRVKKLLTQEVAGVLKAAGLDAAIRRPKLGIKRSGFEVRKVNPFTVAIDYADWEDKGDREEMFGRALHALQAADFDFVWGFGSGRLRGDEALAMARKGAAAMVVRYERPSPVRKAQQMYIGPRGGKWADPAHTIPWKPEEPRKLRAKTGDLPEVAPGTALAALESGSKVDDALKVRLLAEFDPLIRSQARRAQRLFGLRDELSHEGGQVTNLTIQDLQMAGVEGLLRAVQSYRPGGSFAALAKMHVRDQVRLHAATQRGLSLPRRHARALGGFVAARAKARRAERVLEPSAAQVAEHWEIRLSDLHDGAGPGRIPADSYEYGGRSHPGRVEMADEFGKLLSAEKGESGSEVLDVLGEAGGAEEALTVHDALAKLEAGLRSLEVVEGERRYRADAGKILRMRYGVGAEPASVSQVSKAVSIERLTSEGWERLGDRQSRTMVVHFEREAMERAKRLLDVEAGVDVLDVRKGEVRRGLLRAAGPDLTPTQRALYDAHRFPLAVSHLLGRTR
jgi:hypothetical protein